MRTSGFLFFLLWCCLPVSAQLEVDIIDVEESGGEEVTPAPEFEDHRHQDLRRTDMLSFLNGNQLEGTLQRVDADGMIWRHPDAASPILFSTANLKQVDLRLDAEASTALQTLPRIELTNGDVLRGEITGLEEGQLMVRSPATGSVRLQADQVTRVVPNVPVTILYEGPGSDEEWEYHNLSGGNQQWFYRDRALYATDRNQVAVFTPQDTPDKVTLTLELEWKGMLNFQLGYWGHNTNNPNQNASVLSLQNNYLRAYRNYNTIGRNNFLNQQIQHDLQDGSTRITLHLDKSRKQAILLLDGSVIGQWRDVFDGEVPGDQILLYAQGDSVVRVSDIQLREWDGELRTDAEESGGGSDWLMTVNGDEFVGTAVQIVEGLLTFKNDFAEFRVPLDRVGELRFDSETRTLPEPQAGEVKVSTISGERVTVGLDQLEDGVMSGRSPAAGDLTLQLKYFSGITFNPEDSRHQEEEWSW
jgi:hypothetical protein